VGAVGKAGGSRMITSYLVHTHRRSLVEVDPPEGSPKVDFRMVLVLRSEELVRTAYMGVQHTHGTVQDSHSPRS
jgi:hypothetical protein